jgi:hypothetical protein
MRLAASASNSTAVKVFVSYSHHDEEWRKALETHLSILKREGLVTVWTDRRILPGERWPEKISENLETADLILLLVSSDFAASDYCWDVEMSRALEREAMGEAVVIPVIIRTVDGWTGTPIGKLKALPDDGVPVAEAASKDAALAQVALGIRTRIANQRLRPLSNDIIEWHLTLKGECHDFRVNRLQTIERKLRKATLDLSVRIKDLTEGSVKLRLESSRASYATLKRLFNEGTLSVVVDAPVVEVSSPLGASISVFSRLIAEEISVSLPATRQADARSTWFPPLVTGMVLENASPLKPGLQIGIHPETNMSQAEIAELQRKLGRYLNTLLVVPGDQAYVNLSPFDEECGIPEPLRRTELGLTLLKQDLDLKSATAGLLHPMAKTGNAFWAALKKAGVPGATISTCLRVWIVAGDCTVHEKMVGADGHVTIEKMGLNVLSETDYATLSHLHQAPERAQNDTALSIFREIVMPKLEQEVNLGGIFGELRQILSVLVLSVWLRRRAGEYLLKAGLLDSGRTAELGLERKSDEISAIQNEYQRLVRDGSWRWVETAQTRDQLVRRLYVAGGISFWESWPTPGSSNRRHCR